EASSEFGDLLSFHGFESLWIYNAKGELLFSTDSTLHDVLHPMIVAQDTGQDSLRLVDATSLSPRHSTTLLFFMPVFNGRSMEGTLIARLAFERIQTILLEETGMGSTGESYIVGSDFRMRSRSRFFPDRTPYDIVVQQESVLQALNNSRERPHIIDDYRGVRVLSAGSALGLDGINWVIFSEMDLEEAMRPVVGLKELMMSLSYGIIPRKRAVADSSNEMGQMGEAINQLIDAFERSAKFANAIGSGQFETPYEKLSDYDTLGTALINMRDQLK